MHSATASCVAAELKYANSQSVPQAFFMCLPSFPLSGQFNRIPSDQRRHYSGILHCSTFHDFFFICFRSLPAQLVRHLIEIVCFFIELCFSSVCFLPRLSSLPWAFLAARQHEAWIEVSASGPAESSAGLLSPAAEGSLVLGSASLTAVSPGSV